jgi:ADP-ribose pyrophosphatase YjhB (NUDIX family)
MAGAAVVTELDLTEAVEAAARGAGQREIHEETGLRVEVGEQIGVFEIIRPPEEHRLIVYSWARPTGGQLHAASDVSELRFCTAEEIAELDLTEICADVLRGANVLPAIEAQP